MAEPIEPKEPVEPKQPEPDGPKTLTQSELDSLMDKHAAKALEKQKADFENKLNDALEKGKSEGERLAQMSAEQKAQEEAKQRLEELEKKENELNQRELKVTVASTLKERELPTDLADYLVELGDADKISNVVDGLQQAVQQGINDGITQRLRQKSPQNGATQFGDDIDKKEFDVMTAAERATLFAQNKELFNKLTGA
ncbi:DUF4355 domain-containing protein [Weissella hellenica]|nr:DUF4355 domain-containing protein [Weissella hellenica]